MPGVRMPLLVQSRDKKVTIPDMYHEPLWSPNDPFPRRQSLATHVLKNEPLLRDMAEDGYNPDIILHADRSFQA